MVCGAKWANFYVATTFIDNKQNSANFFGNKVERCKYYRKKPV